MVQYTDAKQVSRLQEPLGYHQVISTGLKDAARMVVRNDNRRRPFSQGIAEYFYLCLARKTITSYML